MSESSNYPIDLNAIKSTKLFKKFVQSKNKSTVESGPKIDNIAIKSINRTNNNLNIEQPNKKQPIDTHHQIDPQEKTTNQNIHQIQPNNSLKQQQQYSQYPNKSMMNMERKTERIRQRKNKFSIQKQQHRQHQTYDPDSNEIQHKMGAYTFSNKGNVNSNNNLIQENYQNYQQPIVKQQTQQQQHQHQQPNKNSINFLTNQLTPKQYQRILNQYQQLKNTLSSQRKNNKNEILKMRQQINSLNKKVYQLASHEDDLIIENKRLKQKTNNQNKSRMNLEESNRELGYQMQELKDMLDGNQQSMTKREEEVSFLRKINEEIKQQNKYLVAENQKYHDNVSMYQREKNVVDREKQSKQMHMHQLRDKINSLINQNSLLKDQIFHCTAKLYQFDQQNKTLKADIRRNHNQQFPIEYLHQQRQHSQSQYQQIPHQPIQHKNHSAYSGHVQEQMQRDNQSGRRGQFARQRPQRRKRQFANQHQAQRQQQVHQEPRSQRKEPQNNNRRQMMLKMQKLDTLNEQLQKLKDAKAMNGAMRRQKITLQRQIQQIQDFLKQNK